MTTKLKIDLSQGLLEVEGSESFVKSIYRDFKTHFAGIEGEEEAKSTRRSRKTAKKVIPEAPTPPPKPADEPVIVEPEPKPPVPSLPAYTYIDDLQLGATAGHPSLVEFMDTKFPITNQERNIVFLYYLQYMLKLKSITLDHIYTCYRVAKIRAPLNIQNSFDQRDWVKTAKNGNVTLTAAGKNYVEKQLPKRVKN